MTGKFKFLLFYVLLVIFQDIVECGRGGGSSRTSSGGGWRKSYSGGSSSHSYSSNSQRSGNSGSNTQTHTGSNNNHGWRNPQSGNSGGSTNYGWNRPQQTQTSNTGTSNYGWKKPEQNSGTNTGSNNYGWKKPEQNSGTNTGSNNYGWKKPNSEATSSNTANKKAETHTNQAPPPYTSHAQTNPHNQAPNGPPPPYTRYDPNKTPNSNTGSYPKGPPPPYTPHDVNKHPSSNIGPGGYPVQPGSHTYNTGYSSYRPPPSYTSTYGYTPHYYPPQNNFGYPGQGIYGGHHGPSYGGMGIYGGSTGHYGYPTSGGWGYPSYGSGGHGSSSGSYDILKGAAIGYLASSVIHKISNPWGYSGAGYGHGYGEYSRPVIINNNVNTAAPGTGHPAPHPQNERKPQPEDKWIHCVAYDPNTKETLINPNCSCTVTTFTDPETNVTTSSHNCTSNNGKEVEDLLTPSPQTKPAKYKDTETYAAGAGVYITTTESTEDAIKRKREEFYKKLEKLVSMGKFSST